MPSCRTKNDCFAPFNETTMKKSLKNSAKFHFFSSVQFYDLSTYLFNHYADVLIVKFPKSCAEDREINSWQKSLEKKLVLYYAKPCTVTDITSIKGKI